MKLIDRDLQHSLLSRIAERYPQRLDSRDLEGEFDKEAIIVNLAYLEDHGLIEAKWVGGSGGDKGRVAIAKATAKGIDFLADDGGLTAILGVVTIRLHEDTVKDLLIERVKESSEPETVKTQVITAIKGLPAGILTTITMESIKKGVPNPMEIIPWIQAYLSAKGH